MVSKLNPDLLHSVESDEFLPPISRWTTLGGMFLVGTVGVAFTVAAVTKYNIVVKAAATVRPSGEIRIVQAALEGTIKTISVKENQVVKQGDAIATIDDSQLQTQKSQLQGNIAQNQLQLSQIAAQIGSIDTQHLAESQLMNRTIASAQADLSRNQRDYSDRQITTQTEVQEAEASLELAKTEMEQYQKLASTGAVAQLQIKQKEQAYKAALARLAKAKTTLNPTAAPVAIATERIAQERARGESTLATLNKERESLLQRQIEVQNQISRDHKELKQVETQLRKTVLRTPETGTILKLELRNPSQVVHSGESIAQIAPSNAPVVVKARVAAQDIAQIKICKEKNILDCIEGKVQLRISAYPYPDYGTLNGAVRAITADAITPQNNQATASAAPYYEVTIEPERLYLQKTNHSYPIQAGMEVTADIISREETLLTFILRKARLLADL